MSYRVICYIELAVKVELLILSHEAYSQAYDMEGISNVLKACRACALQLDTVSYYSLMVCILCMYVYLYYAMVCIYACTI